MIVLAIDPGTEESGWVEWDADEAVPLRFGKHPNIHITSIIRSDAWLDVVIEEVESYGMRVGRDVFDTVHWSGRFYQIAIQCATCRVHRMPRRRVKQIITGKVTSKDADVRQALIDRFGGKAKAIGSKKEPGPLYGVKKDVWAALALAIAFCEEREFENKCQ